MKAVRFDRYGDESVLYLSEVELPELGQDQVIVCVRAAGVNTGEVGIRDGSRKSMSPAHFPEGQGTELAGVVHAVGETVGHWQSGDAVVAMSETRGAQAEYALIETQNLFAKPDDMAWSTAASTPIAGATATAVMLALEPRAGETLVVAGASGSVGIVVVQRAVAAGSRVIATASEPNHKFLRGLGAEPVTYGEGLEDRIREITPHGVDAFADCYGGGNVDVAMRLDVSPDRINTIKDFGAVERIGCKALGMYQLDDIPAAVQATIDAVENGHLQVPVKATYPLPEVQDAYRRLTQPGGVGKVVLVVSDDDD